jgi:hypothetical protein
MSPQIRTLHSHCGEVLQSKKVHNIRHTGQNRRHFKAGHKERGHDSSRGAKCILNMVHEYGKMEENVDILKLTPTRRDTNTWIQSDI